jgi:hypothetical protein
MESALKWDFNAGYRNPMRWAKYESWHETASWSYEIYTASKLKLPFTFRLYDTEGHEWGNMTWTPLVLLWDVTPLEIMAMWWPEGNEELGSKTNDTCLYTGWFYKFWQPKIDVSYTVYQCTYDMYDLGEGYACEYSTASIGYLEEWKAKQLKKSPVKYRSEDGMYEAGFNTCHEKPAFNARKGIFRPMCWDGCDDYVKDYGYDMEGASEKYEGDFPAGEAAEEPSFVEETPASSGEAAEESSVAEETPAPSGELAL